jgi:hypothetical protein
MEHLSSLSHFLLGTCCSVFCSLCSIVYPLRAFLSLFFSLLYCLSFKSRLLNTPLVSSNPSPRKSAVLFRLVNYCQPKNSFRWSFGKKFTFSISDSIWWMISYIVYHLWIFLHIYQYIIDTYRYYRMDGALLLFISIYIFSTNVVKLQVSTEIQFFPISA